MQKKFYIAILLCSIIFLGSCAVKSKYFKNQTENESILFKEKYESLNNKQKKNMLLIKINRLQLMINQLLIIFYNCLCL